MTTAEIVLAKYKAEHKKTERKLRELLREIHCSELFWDMPKAQHAKHTFGYYHDYWLVCQGAIMALEEAIKRDNGTVGASHGTT